MFRKLKYHLKKIPDKSEFKGNLIKNYGGVLYHTLKKSYLVVPIELLKLQPEIMFWTEINNDSRSDLPHRDHNAITSLNMYVDTGLAVTEFYTVKPNAAPYSPNPEIFQENTYYLTDLEYFSEFQAKPYDTYLLDVSRPHRVIGVESDVRSIIQLRWKTKSFDQILNEIGNENVY